MADVNQIHHTYGDLLGSLKRERDEAFAVTQETVRMVPDLFAQASKVIHESIDQHREQVRRSLEQASGNREYEVRAFAQHNETREDDGLPTQRRAGRRRGARASRGTDLYFEGGQLRKTALAREFVKARAELLDSTKRMMVDLRRVSDPEYRAELQRRGVKASPVNPLLQGSPGVGAQVLAPDLKPPRARPRPARVGVSAIAGMNELRPGRLGFDTKPDRASGDPTRRALAVAVAGGLAAAAIGAIASTDHRDSSDD